MSGDVHVRICEGVRGKFPCATRLIVGCEFEDDALWVMKQIKIRFAQFALTIHPEKSAVIDFRPGLNKSKSGNGKGTFVFLGFTHYWAKSRRGLWVIKRKTSSKKIKSTKRRIWLWCRNNKHEPIKKQYEKICQKIRGHFQYFAIRCNYRALEKVLSFVHKAWHYWLSRRTRKKLTWEKFEKIMRTYPLPRPRILHNI